MQLKFKILWLGYMAVGLSMCLLFVCNCSPVKRTSTTISNTKHKKSKGLNTLVRFEDCKSLSQTIDRAQSSHQLIFMDFYADWCIPCKVMDQEVFNDVEVADLLNNHFINVKINGELDNGPDLVAMHEVSSYPSYIWLDSKGVILHREVGALSRSKFLSITADIISRLKR